MRLRLAYGRTRDTIARYGRDRRGNVLMIFAFAVIPLTFATGMSIDYGQAMRLQTKLNAAADAAALTATSQAEMDETVIHAADRAKKVFQVQVDDSINLVPIEYTDPAQFFITVVDTPTATGTTRVSTVTYRAQSRNLFSKILGTSTLTIKGTSQSTASTAPNIDFYLMMDVSGSMALPTTTAGLTQLKAATVSAANPTGCAFACHATNADKAKDKNGNLTDFYGVARSYGIPLRVDAEGLAAQDLMKVAKSTSAANSATYRMSVSTFSEAGTFKNTASLTTDLDAAGTTAATAQVSNYYQNNCPTSSRCNSDQDSGHSDAFTQLNTLMPAPGTGNKLDKPQEIMFLITDGARDEKRAGADGQYPEVGIDTALCTAIKNRGIRIAILYTEYLPGAINNESWSNTHVTPFLYKIEPALQACASDGLYYKVSTDDDISAALNALFLQAVSTSHLVR